MAIPFNAEEYRQQMSGQKAQAHLQQGQMPVTQPPPVPAQYVPPMVQAEMAAPQTHPSPQPAYQAMPAPAMPHSQQPPQMAQAWAGQEGLAPQAYQSHPGQPPQHQPQAAPHTAPAQMFAPPPGLMPKTEEIAPPKKMSRFKLKRGRKEKPAKAPKGKAVKEPNLDVNGEIIQKARTSPAMIFMFGMATGILCFLLGNMAMSGLLEDKSVKSFAEIERKNAMAQQPVLPAQTLEQTSLQTAENNR
jgi:hypothetical protein